MKIKPLTLTHSLTHLLTHPLKINYSEIRSGQVRLGISHSHTHSLTHSDTHLLTPSLPLPSADPHFRRGELPRTSLRSLEDAITPSLGSLPEAPPPPLHHRESSRSSGRRRKLWGTDVLRCVVLVSLAPQYWDASFFIYSAYYLADAIDILFPLHSIITSTLFPQEWQQEEQCVW